MNQQQAEQQRVELNVKRQPSKKDVWKARSRQVYADAVMALAFSFDGKTLASAGQDTPNASNNSLGVRMLDGWTLASTHHLKHLKRASFVRFLPDLKRIVTNGDTWDDMHLLDANSGKTLWSAFLTPSDYPQGDNTIQSYLIHMVLSPRGDQVAGGNTTPTGTGGNEFLWQIQDGKMEQRPLNSGSWMNRALSAAFSPDGKRLLIGGEDRIVVVCSTSTGKLIWEKGVVWKPDYKGDAVAVAWSLDGKTLATAHRDNSVSFWNADNGQKRLTSKAFSSPIQLVTFSPDSTMLASGSQDGTVVLSSTRNGETLHIWNVKHGAVTALAFASDSSHLAGGYQGGTVALWSRQP